MHDLRSRGASVIGTAITEAQNLGVILDSLPLTDVATDRARRSLELITAGLTHQAGAASKGNGFCARVRESSANSSASA
jgi:hypothetical protein